MAEVNVTGGATLTAGTSVNTGLVYLNSEADSYGSINVYGAGSSFVTPMASGINLFSNAIANSTNTFTVGNGGTLQTALVTNATAAASQGTLTFNDGTLMATAATAVGQTAGGLIGVNVPTYVQSGGATINNGGFAVAVNSPLQAPTGFGVATINLVARPLAILGRRWW